MLGGGLHHDLGLSPVLRARRRREYRPLGHDRWPSASAHPRQRQPAGDYAHDHPSGYERRRFLQELSARAPGIVSLPAVVILFLHSLPNCRGATPDFGPHYIRMCAEGTASPPGKNPSRFGRWSYELPVSRSARCVKYRGAFVFETEDVVSTRSATESPFVPLRRESSGTAADVEAGVGDSRGLLISDRQRAN